jgi:hypothetical protein
MAVRGDAAQFYDVEVVAHRRDGSLPRAVRRAATALAGASFGFLPSPSVGDLVVIRRETGAELMRKPAGDRQEASGALARARADLLTLSVEDFASEWGIGPRP